ncbi:3-hydroxyacyl-CoA dehydrogenase NAD-binding domain-containing protein [Dokdonella sp.]|uniref:3-hydroxyacyl-CoA dehydrogenase NAD-binding domain-containing protein n=1 Tax=Dokdonella sp. TaxID=2291710 RepID=UPI0025C0E6F6|nr:3-hydroxyacyl-CoA dehydrogenase NAD-binding domain-containing protein [Dokdonella sp.]MBX3689645.1 enoyl-CoA hydratase/isomerase family protein [Dokdonella sp.]
MFEGLRFQHWQATLGTDGIVELALDRAGSSVNALSRAVVDELAEIVERLSFEPPRGVILRSAKAGFVVGADIKEFESFEKAGTIRDVLENGQRVFQRLAGLPCPTVAAIHGVCMGGGTELALACRQRVATRDPATRIALPEVKLGIFPGWGGSSRLPYLIGAPAALEFMLTGRAASAENARAIGLVDALAAPDLLMATARELIAHPRPRPLKQRLLAWATNLWPARQILAAMISKQTAAKVRKDQYPAPFALIDTWRRGGGIGQRLRNEARAVARLATTPTARNLIRVFFLQERLKSAGSGVDHGIQHVHVVGAGVMGGDIAAWCALRGFDVTLQDREMKYVQPALDRARTLFEKKLKTPERIQPALARLKADVEGNGITTADLLIEAIYENAQAKEDLYKAAEPKMKATALLATNTSSIPLDELRKAVAQPARFLGLHYFNPVALMPLVEIVRQDHLDGANEKRALAFCKAIGKLPIAVAGSPGFLVNRTLMPYMLEAARACAEGIPAPVIDKAAKKFGMPMGPIELIDTVGLDVAASVGAELGPFLKLDIPPAIAELVGHGKRGKKDGEGFYKWQDGKAQKPQVDPHYVAPDDLEDRIILPLINEAVACLHDGVIDDPDLLDAGLIFGTGFAPFRGGPIQYIRDSGADALVARLEKLAARHGERFQPRPGWDSPALRSSAKAG